MLDGGGGWELTSAQGCLCGGGIFKKFYVEREVYSMCDRVKTLISFVGKVISDQSTRGYRRQFVALNHMDMYKSRSAKDTKMKDIRFGTKV